MAYDRGICHRRHTNADMAVHQCIKCNGWWATNCSAGLAITRYCPDCIPGVYPHTLGTDWKAQRYTDSLDARVIADERRDRLDDQTEKLLHGSDLAEDEPLPWPEQYAELRQLGYGNWDIARHFGISLESLERQLHRYGIPLKAREAS
jgi:hypothetical protein